MSELTTKQARDDFSAAVNRVAFGGERIVLTRRGKPLAVVVPLADLAQLEATSANVSTPPRADVRAEGDE
jgi:prevent-host-death family protein